MIDIKFDYLHVDKWTAKQASSTNSSLQLEQLTRSGYCRVWLANGRVWLADDWLDLCFWPLKWLVIPLAVLIVIPQHTVGTNFFLVWLLPWISVCVLFTLRLVSLKLATDWPHSLMLRQLTDLSHLLMLRQQTDWRRSAGIFCGDFPTVGWCQTVDRTRTLDQSLLYRCVVCRSPRNYLHSEKNWWNFYFLTDFLCVVRPFAEPAMKPHNEQRNQVKSFRE